jgi:hypothetical protein
LSRSNSGFHRLGDRFGGFADGQPRALGKRLVS